MVRHMRQAETSKIAIGVPLSGKPAAMGQEMANAAIMAVEEANRDYALKIEPWLLDDKGDETAGLEAARAIAADDTVLGLVGHYNSNVGLVAGPLYAEAGLAVIGPIVSNPRLTESGWRNVFRFTNRDDATADAIADHLVHRLHKRRAAIVATRTVYGGSMSDEFVRAFGRHGGTTLARHAVDEGETTFTALVRDLPKEIDLVFYGGTFEGAPLLRALRTAGLNQLLATGDGCWDVGNFLQPTGEDTERGEGVLVLSACPEIGVVPGSKEFARCYEARFGPLRNYAVNAYDATCTLLAAIAAVPGERDSRAVRPMVTNALRGLRRQGIAYPTEVRWDGKGDNVAAVTALHRVENGHFKQVALITP
jgi:branched-chain amino acid transport system substrate-binding protein